MKFMLTNPEEMAFYTPFTATKKGYIDRLDIDARSVQRELSKEAARSLKNVDINGYADMTSFFWKIESYGIKTVENVFRVSQKDDNLMLLTFKCVAVD